MKRSFFIFVCISALASCGCSDFTPRFDRETFNRERQLWLDQDIQNYTLQLSFHNDSWGGTVTVFVKNGFVTRFYFHDRVPLVYETPSDYAGRGDALFNHPFTLSVSDMYTEIEKHANSNRYECKIDSHYSGEWHYPVSIMVARSTGDAVTMSIRAFAIDP